MCFRDAISDDGQIRYPPELFEHAAEAVFVHRLRDLCSKGVSVPRVHVSGATHLANEELHLSGRVPGAVRHRVDPMNIPASTLKFHQVTGTKYKKE